MPHPQVAFRSGAIEAPGTTGKGLPVHDRGEPQAGGLGDSVRDGDLGDHGVLLGWCTGTWRAPRAAGRPWAPARSGRGATKRGFVRAVCGIELMALGRRARTAHSGPTDRGEDAATRQDGRLIAMRRRPQAHCGRVGEQRADSDSRMGSVVAGVQERAGARRSSPSGPPTSPRALPELLAAHRVERLLRRVAQHAPRGLARLADQPPLRPPELVGSRCGVQERVGRLKRLPVDGEELLHELDGIGLRPPRRAALPRHSPAAPRAVEGPLEAARPRDRRPPPGHDRSAGARRSLATPGRRAPPSRPSLRSLVRGRPASRR